MKIWIDTEFNEFRGALISMALIDENGREFYRSVGCESPGAWVAENVMPIIGIDPIPIQQFQTELQDWLSIYDAIHVIADWPEDIQYFCQVLITGPGVRINTPLLTMEVDRSINAPSDLPHNALADVRGIWKVCAPTAAPENGELANLREALQTGLEAAQQVAASFHETYYGYYPDKHASVDEDVKCIEDAIATLAPIAQQKEWT